MAQSRVLDPVGVRRASQRESGLCRSESPRWLTRASSRRADRCIVSKPVCGEEASTHCRCWRSGRMRRLSRQRTVWPGVLGPR